MFYLHLNIMLIIKYSNVLFTFKYFSNEVRLNCNALTVGISVVHNY